MTYPISTATVFLTVRAPGEDLMMGREGDARHGSIDLGQGPAHAVGARQGTSLEICPLHIQAKSLQQLSSFSAPFSFFINSLIPFADIKRWFCARPCAGALLNVKAEVEEGAAVSWVCGGHGAGVGTESQRQADRCRALLVLTTQPQMHLTQQGYPATPPGILSQQNFWLLSPL